MQICEGLYPMKKIYTDVTNIPELTQYTGISRVVSEIVIRLVKENADVVPLSWSPADHAYRVLDGKALAENMESMSRNPEKCYTGELLLPEQFEEDSVFFEANSCWHTLPNRSWLLPELKKRRVRIMVLIHDIIPVRTPQYMKDITLLRFMEFLTAHMTWSDDIMVTTHAVEEDILNLFDELEMRPKPIHVIGLGADFTAQVKKSDEAVDMKIIRKLKGRRFLLTVGTVEPRKNHKVLVDAYEKKISSLDTDVVIVGRTGWGMDELISRIEGNKKYGKGIYLLSDVNDATLAKLYSMAYMVVFPSYTEGYGLPTIEALISGIPTVCSDIPVMREVGGDFCEYFPADDSTVLADIVESYVSSEEKYSSLKTKITEKYAPPRWNTTVSSILKAVNTEKCDDGFEHRPVKQIVFLSARPEPLLATLPYIEEFMPFIKELVVICPDFMADFMKENYRGRLELKLATDNQVLAGAALPADHSTRNFFLRCLAMKLDILDDEFIMSDDDYRPLGYTEEDFFFRDGKYRGFYFADISEWKYRIADLFSYDYCHFRTLEFLKKNGFPTRQYSSHQPQIINRKWYCELLEEFPDIMTLGYDEWSTYFNYCAVRHSDRYQAVPYATLSWPNIGGENLGPDQSEYAFENFYEDNYKSKGKFCKFSPVFTDVPVLLAENKEKTEMALSFREKFNFRNKKIREFDDEYEKKMHIYPHFAVWFHGEEGRPPAFSGPDYLRLSTDCLNRIRFGISRAEKCAENIMPVELAFAVVDEKGVTVCAGSRKVSPRLEYTRMDFGIKKGDYSSGQYFIRVSVRNCRSGSSAEKTIPVEIVNDLS